MGCQIELNKVKLRRMPNGDLELYQEIDFNFISRPGMLEVNNKMLTKMINAKTLVLSKKYKYCIYESLLPLSKESNCYIHNGSFKITKRPCILKKRAYKTWKLFKI